MGPPLPELRLAEEARRAYGGPQQPLLPCPLLTGRPALLLPGRRSTLALLPHGIRPPSVLGPAGRKQQTALLLQQMLLQYLPLQAAALRLHAPPVAASLSAFHLLLRPCMPVLWIPHPAWLLAGLPLHGPLMPGLALQMAPRELPRPLLLLPAP